MRKPVFQLIFLLLITFTPAAYTQILAPSADFSDTTFYYNGKTDSIFVFNIDNDSPYIYADTVNYTGYTFQWESYSPGIGFQVMAETSSRLKIPASPVSQGYRLVLNNGTSDTAVCWVFNNDFEVEIVTKDEDGNITQDALTSGDCLFIGYIEMDYIRDTLFYYNPSTNEKLTFEMAYTYRYETEPVISDAGVGSVKNADPLNNRLRFYIQNSWWEDAIYTITIIDDAQLERSDDVNVTAIRPKAVLLSPTAAPLDDRDLYPNRSEAYYNIYGEDYNNKHKPAPNFYLFESESKNADSLTWHFGDSTFVTTDTSSVYHEYKNWGTFKPRLEVVNYFDFRRECYDVDVGDEFEIDPPQFAAGQKGSQQNAFTPPNGANPIWRMVDVSILDFEIAIYNRYGRRVHYFKGNIRDWEGWDGRVNNSTNMASTGVYFYVLKKYSATPSFDETPHEIGDEVMKGTIHLFNTE
ncbi:MAG TPA: hypothetical protein DDX98_13905 [Bacteroidales bacterium]|jgi:gliding motility-associated-like protein|nr:hypothetical protein [Bacteroidales bacterium]